MQPADIKATSAAFYSKAGLQFEGLSAQQLLTLRNQSLSTLGISNDQVAEASSYSLAMVVRFALGLSAQGGASIAILTPSLSGCVAAATVRHLVNAGGVLNCYILRDAAAASQDFDKQLKILNGMQVPLLEITNSKEDLDKLQEQIVRCHNVINGTFDLAAPDRLSEILNRINMLLNEARTPVHCVECPSGLDPDSGKQIFTPLFASSTLSLGAPLSGLFHGQAHAGRHYVCDISLTRQMYESAGFDLTSLFSEQPVVQIFPVASEEE